MIDRSTWGSKLHELVKENKVDVSQYNLDLSYDYWTYCKYVLVYEMRSMIADRL